MRLDRLLTLYLFRPLRALGLGSRGGRRLPVLMYHSISDDPEPNFSPYYKVCTSPQRFAEHMQWLAEAGYRGVTLAEGLSWLKDDPCTTNDLQKVAENAETNPSARSANSCKNSGEKYVAITFDDGFRDFHTEAFPILQRHGFAATMYLPTAYIGDERRSFKGRECLTWSEVRELHDAGMEFGSHTVNHPKLVELDWPEIERELRESKSTIEQRLGCPSHAFAYPFAFPQANISFRTRFLTTLRSAGYDHCATTEIGIVKPPDDPLRLKRLPANSCDDEPLFAAKLAGAYDWAGRPQKAMKHFKSLKKAQ